MLLDMGQQIIVAEPLSSAGNGSLFAARPVFPGKRGGAAAAASSSAGGSGGGGGRYGNLAAGELVGAGPFFLDLKNGAGPPPGAGGARPATRFVAGSRMAKARESAKRRGPAAGPADKRDGQQRDAAGLEREVADLRDAATKADRRRKELQSKLVKAEKEAVGEPPPPQPQPQPSALSPCPPLHGLTGCRAASLSPARPGCRSWSRTCWSSRSRRWRRSSGSCWRGRAGWRRWRTRSAS